VTEHRSIDDLIERSSLGTPAADQARSRTPDEVVQELRRRHRELEADDHTEQRVMSWSAADAARPAAEPERRVFPQRRVPVPTRGVDLNELRTRVLRNQAQGNETPTRPQDKVLVDHDGKIVMGSDLQPEAARELAEVHQGVFASLEDRVKHDAAVVAKKLPSNAEFARVQGTPGWFYGVESEFGDHYEFFVYFNGSSYQVKVVEPEVEGRFSPHDGHLYEDGRICFGQASGMPTLESAYAKSVLWANGFSAYDAAKRAGRPIPFPFSLNNYPSADP
jgi:hypothetical protein